MQIDLAAVLALSPELIRSVQTPNVTRFDQILAAAFRCPNPDGSLALVLPGSGRFVVRPD